MKSILVTDDGSTDNSLDILNKYDMAYEKINFIGKEIHQNIGAHNRINLLVDAASTEWITILNSDDFYSSSSFGTLERWLRHNPCDIFFGNINIVDQADCLIGSKLPGTSLQYVTDPPDLITRAIQEEDWLSLLLNQNFIATTTNICFKKRLWGEIGEFADYRYAHDWDFFIRSCMHGKMCHNPNFWVNYRVHPANTLKEGEKLIRKEVRALFQKLASTYKTENLLSAAKNQMLAKSLLLSNPQLYPAAAFSRHLNQNHHLREQSASLYRSTDISSIMPSISAHALVDSADPDEVRNSLLGLELSFVPIICCYRTFQLTGTIKFLAVDVTKVFKLAKEEIYRNSIAFVKDNSSPPINLADLCSFDVFELALDNALNAYRCQLSNLVLSKDWTNIHAKHYLCPPVILGRKQRILIVTGFFAVGGVEKATLDTIKSLSYCYEFCILCTEYHSRELGSLMDNARAFGVHIYYANQITKSTLLDVAQRLHESYEFHVCWIINGSTLLWDQYHALKASLGDVIIIDNQVYDTEMGWIDKFNSDTSSYAHYFVAINTRIQDIFTSKYRIAASCVTMIYPSFSSQKFSKDLADPNSQESLSIAMKAKEMRAFYEIPDDAKVYVNVGRCDPQKNQKLFVDFAVELNKLDQKTFYLIIGDGPIAVDIDQYIEQSGTPNIKRLGFFDDVRPFYHLAEFLVITSNFEGLPIVLLEAHAMGTPVASVPVGDIDIVVNHYGSGLIFQSRRPSEMAMQVFRNSPASFRINRDQFFDAFSSFAMTRAYKKVFNKSR